MPLGRTIVDSEDEEQDSRLPSSSPPAARAPLVHPSNSSPGAPSGPDPSATTSTEALNRSIHNAHFALIEPTPDPKTALTIIRPDLQAGVSSPLLPRTKRGDTRLKPDPPLHDEFTFIVSSASEFSPPPAKRVRGKTTGPTVKVKDRKPRRSKSMGRTPDPAVEEESDTWEPVNASKLLGEPTGLRRTRRMGDDGVVDGLPKPKRLKNCPLKEPVHSEIKIDLTDDNITLSATQKQQYERISVPPSSLPQDPVTAAVFKAPTISLERDTDQSSTIPFSSSPPIRDRFPEGFKLSLEESQAAKLPSPAISTPMSKPLKDITKTRRAKTVMGTGNEHLDRYISGDELSSGFELKKPQRRQPSGWVGESGSKSEIRGVKSGSKVSQDHMSDEDELGSEGIGIGEECYKLRPSRSSGDHVMDKENNSVAKGVPTEMVFSEIQLEDEKADVPSPAQTIHSEEMLRDNPSISSADEAKNIEAPRRTKGTGVGDSNCGQQTKPIAGLKRKKSTVVQEDEVDDSGSKRQPKPIAKPKRKKSIAVRDDKDDDHASPNQENLPTNSKPTKKPKADDPKAPSMDRSPLQPPLSTNTIPPPEPPTRTTPPPLNPNPKKKPGQHSPLNNGRVPYRVGLSKRARIEPLLRCVRK